MVRVCFAFATSDSWPLSIVCLLSLLVKRARLSIAQKKGFNVAKQQNFKPARGSEETPGRVFSAPLSKPCIEVGWRRSTLTGV